MSGVKYQIFISSTYEDLKAEREEVIKATLEMGHIPVGMEMFSAADEEQWKIITRQIDQSDYYVIIVAHRYGSVIKGVSYTEKEYNYAIERGVPILGFVIENTAKWPANLMETDPKKKISLEKFKRKIKKKPVDFWSVALDLRAKYPIALTKEINTSPRPGWVRSTEVAGPEVLTEISRLSSENAHLRKRLEEALRLSNVVQAMTPSKPELRVTFRNGAEAINASSSDWLKPYESTTPNTPLGVYGGRNFSQPAFKQVLVTPPPRTIEVSLQLDNVGTSPASNFRVLVHGGKSTTFSQVISGSISLKNGSAVAHGSVLNISGSKISHGESWNVTAWATFISSQDTHEWAWECHADNMPQKTTGILKVNISDEETTLKM